MHCGDFLMVHFAARLLAADTPPLKGSLQGLPGTLVLGTGGLLNLVLLMTGAISASVCKNSMDSSDSTPSNKSLKVSCINSWERLDCSLPTFSRSPSWLNSTKLFLVHWSVQCNKASFSICTSFFSQSV